MISKAKKRNDEIEIKRVIENGVEALRAKDIDGVMSMYAPELVSFDIVPPLQYVGTDAYRKQWGKVFSTFLVLFQETSWGKREKWGHPTPRQGRTPAPLFPNHSFDSALGPINYEIADLSITVGDDVAFAHSFNRLSATLNNGQEIGNWLRWTACFQKINGKWLIVHMQASVPVDRETGKAVLDLKP